MMTVMKVWRRRCRILVVKKNKAIEKELNAVLSYAVTFLN